MSPRLFWLCLITLCGSGLASDVPFVFGEDNSNLTDYSSDQLQEASSSSPDLVGVPPVISPSDSEVLEIPVTGGGSTPEGKLEKGVKDLKDELNKKVEPDYISIREDAVMLASKYPGDLGIDQINEIYIYMKYGNQTKNGWRYVRDPRGIDSWNYANASMKIGDRAKCVGLGDCDDFAILMAAFVESIGGATRIILANNNSKGGHAYTEVYLGRINDPNCQVEAIMEWLQQESDTGKIYGHVDTDTKEVWLNLDWGPDEKGNAHPGGPLFQGERHDVLRIRDQYKLIPVRMPETPDKPPRLISLAPDKNSPQKVGSVVTWTAKAMDPDNDRIFYRFFLNGYTVTKWINDNSWVWTTTEADTDDNKIEVYVRDGKHAGPNGFDSNKVASFTITEAEQKPTVLENQPPVIVSMVSDKSGPQDTETIVTWTAEASDPESDSLVYRFLLRGKTVSDWSSASSWSWATTSDEIGENQIEVQVRDGKHVGPNGFDSNKVASFTIVESKPAAPENLPPVINSLVPDKDSPQKIGALITWTVVAKDTENNPISYKFYLNGKAMTGWSTENTWPWSAEDADAGVNQIEVKIRDGFHADPNSFDDNMNVNYKITALPSTSTEEKWLPSKIISPTETNPVTTIPSAKIGSIYVEHNVWQGDNFGMIIHTKFYIDNFAYETGSVQAYFSFGNNAEILDTDGNYASPDGQVSSFESFTPIYRKTEYNDFKLFIPYSQLHLLLKMQNNLIVDVFIWDNSDYPHTKLAESSIHFIYTS